ncbi:hypothetical protein [Clostridium kluyveri]|uniref:Uncharacterized protein n=1 Tax=Clostridium kluyveri TaxID=1534 RepID=A0A1L5F2Y2_CLOKL|nr:hypothetical protein [Clostridium kluyveri]APM37347.1 hypothetical protein BS101_00485 [Clostridium kluyveri]
MEVMAERKHIDLTKHCKVRYVERVKGITGNFAVQEYVAANNERIIQDVNKIFTYSDFLTEDQIGGDKTTKRFYIKDDILLVLRSDESAIITLIKVDFGFPVKTNRNIVKDLLVEINLLKEDLEENERSIVDYVNARTLERERYFDKIQLLQEEINSLNLTIKQIDVDIEKKKESTKVSKLKLKEYVNMICNSRAFKDDLKQMGK